tara:strand:- start:219 stop:587 length:369 start_codon:yes stop_codon:yes gene_type:complete
MVAAVTTLNNAAALEAAQRYPELDKLSADEFNRLTAATQDDRLKAKAAMDEVDAVLRRTVVLANEFGGRFQLSGFPEDADSQKKLSKSVESLKGALRYLEEVHSYLASQVPPPRPWWRRIWG